MPEEIEVPTEHLQDKLQELHHEHEAHDNEHEAHQDGTHKHADRPAWTSVVALTTAIMAVVAAIAAMEAGALVNKALIARQNAAISQNLASDQWSYYQARQLKGFVSEAVVDTLTQLHARSSTIGKWTGRVIHYGVGVRKANLPGQSAGTRPSAANADDPMATARGFEKLRDEEAEESNQLLEKHEVFSLAVTLTQVAIALSAIAALTRRRAVWYAGLGAGVIGLAFALMGVSKPAPHHTSPQEGPVAADAQPGTAQSAPS